MPVTDQELIEKAKRGDNAAFGELWSRYEREVVGLCRRYLSGSRHDPVVDEDDLATEAFIRALHGLERYEDQSAEGVGVGAWLLEIAKRICLKFLSKQRRREQWTAPLDEDEELSDQPDFAPLVEQVVEDREMLRLAVQAINTLPPLYRAPFKLLLEEYSQKEIAEALGISVDNAAKRVQRARAMLRSQLGELLGVEPPTPSISPFIRESKRGCRGGRTSAAIETPGTGNGGAGADRHRERIPHRERHPVQRG